MSGVAEKKVRLTITLWDDTGSGMDILDIAVDLGKLKESIREFEHEKKKWENYMKKIRARKKKKIKT